jgi:antitoxin VapB
MDIEVDFDMAISIKDPETDELARQLAGQTGETITQALKEALRERLTRIHGRRGRTGVSARLLAIGQRCAAHMHGPGDSLDHGDLFYDERGLPK